MRSATSVNEPGWPRLPSRAAAAAGMGTTGQPGDGPARERGQHVERRNHASRQQLLRRIALEYGEMPGLCLTVAQAQRLFALPREACVRVLEKLVNEGVLRRRENGSYGCEKPRP